MVFIIIKSLCIPEIKRKKPRDSTQSPKKKKGKNPWETDSDEGENSFSSGNEPDDLPTPVARTTGRRAAGKLNAITYFKIILI